jgi:hypothetical protein
MAMSPMGYDCTQASFANKTVCSDVTTACENDIPLIACSDSTANTWNWPASCATFWGSF